MATFFGEVIDVSSRSAWWSDSDDEDNGNGNDKKKSPQESSFSLNIEENGLFSNICSTCEQIYVTNVKNFNKDWKTILKISIENSTSNILLGTLNFIDDQKCWLTINHKSMYSRQQLTVKLVDFIFKKVLNNFKSSNLEILIISKDLSQLSYIQYLKSTQNCDRLNNFVLDLQKKYPINVLLAPKTSQNELELAFMEYCIIHKRNFILFILPSVLDIGFIPNPILNCLNQFKNFSQSNLII